MILSLIIVILTIILLVFGIKACISSKNKYEKELSDKKAEEITEKVLEKIIKDKKIDDHNKECKNCNEKICLLKENDKNE